MIDKTEHMFEEDINDFLEESFDLCQTNREEIYWLITVLRGFMNIGNKRTEPEVDTYKLNYWQYILNPAIQRLKKKYWC